MLIYDSILQYLSVYITACVHISFIANPNYFGSSTFEADPRAPSPCRILTTKTGRRIQKFMGDTWGYIASKLEGQTAKWIGWIGLDFSARTLLNLLSWNCYYRYSTFFFLGGGCSEFESCVSINQQETPTSPSVTMWHHAQASSSAAAADSDWSAICRRPGGPNYRWVDTCRICLRMPILHNSTKKNMSNWDKALFLLQWSIIIHRKLVETYVDD